MIPGFDLRAAAARLAIRRRYTALLRHAGANAPIWWKRLAAGKRANRQTPAPRRPSVNSSTNPQSHDREQPIHAYRARLHKAFILAEERGHVPLAVSLLEQGLSPAAIESAIAALPIQARRGPSLAERMASIPRPDVGSGPSNSAADTPKGRAAGLIRAYNKATSSQA